MSTALDKKYHLLGLAGALLLVLAVLVLSVQQFALSGDAAAKLREQKVVENGFRARIQEIESSIKPNTIWDQAVIHLDNKFDQTWASENIGSFFTSSGGFEFSYVLGARNQPLYGMRAGSDVAPKSYAVMANAAQRLVDAVRVREVERIKAPVDDPLSNPIQASAPLWIEGQLFLTTATLVQPDFGHAQIAHGAAPIVVTGLELGPHFLDAISARYLLNDLHLHEGDTRFEQQEAHAAVMNDRGEQVATLDWLPQTPGSALFHRVLPGLIAFVLVALAITSVFYFRARRHSQHLVAAQKQATFKAYHDDLTGIPNRAHLELALSELLADVARQPFAVHTLDLDRFKDINDVHGHLVGDELLCAAASRLTNVCSDVYACTRMGGDEFTILQVLIDEADAAALAEKIIRELAKPYALSIGQAIVPCSIGTVIADSAAKNAVELMRRADIALYRAKAEGRRKATLFTPEMDDYIQRMHLLKDDLRAAIGAKELRMVYQPQVRLNGDVAGLEALARWTHPVHGPISPSVFVPLAEEAGLSRELGEFTMRQVARDCHRWKGMKVAVNVTATQVRKPSFIDRILTILREEGASSHNIEIELTESVLFDDTPETAETLRRLREEGFTVALDDFGTGYSSLSYLQRFPIEKIKIDKSFVDNLGKAPKSDALFAAIVRLAQALDMRVIAEGVETTEQWLRLTRAGCPKIQGYIASRPLEVDDVATFLTSDRYVHRMPDDAGHSAAADLALQAASL